MSCRVFSFRSLVADFCLLVNSHHDHSLTLTRPNHSPCLSLSSPRRCNSLSYFYDRIAPLGLTSPFSISSLRTLTSNVCAGRSSPTWSRFKGNAEAKHELDDRPEYCLDLTFMLSLLSLGYELEEERMVWMGKQVNGVELGW